MSGTELCALRRVNILDGKEGYKESQAPFQGERSKASGHGKPTLRWCAAGEGRCVSVRGRRALGIDKLMVEGAGGSQGQLDLTLSLYSVPGTGSSPGASKLSGITSVKA